MLTVDSYEEIRQAHYRDGKGIRQIAREQHHTRRVIRAALAQATPPGYQLRQARPAPVLDAVAPIIAQWLAEDQQRPKKQRHTAHRIWQRLRDEYQFSGAEGTVRRYVGKQRPAAAGAQAEGAMIPLAFAAGEDAQADFGQAQAIIAGKLETVHYCAVKLCFSQLPFVVAFPHERQEAFLEGLAESFAFFGGVPARVSLDNATSLVKTILSGHQREEQTAFIAFRSHYLFSSYFCTPGEGHEKGKVENLVGTSRRACFVPLPEVASYAALNAHLRAYCEAEKGRTLRGATATIGALWEQERRQFRALPRHSYPIGRLLPAVVSRSATVQFETNRYSVPALYHKREVLIRAGVWRIEILAERGTRLIARHERCYERDQDILDPRHYLGLLAQRPGALAHCQAIQQWQREGRWPAIFGRYLTALRTAHPSGGAAATKEYVRILALYAEPDGDRLPTVLEEALRLRCFSFEAVKLLLQRQRQPSGNPPPLDLATQPGLSGLAQHGTALPDLGRYDALLHRPAPQVPPAVGS